MLPVTDSNTKKLGILHVLRGVATAPHVIQSQLEDIPVPDRHVRHVEVQWGHARRELSAPGARQTIGRSVPPWESRGGFLEENNVRKHRHTATCHSVIKPLGAGSMLSKSGGAPNVLCFNIRSSG